MANQGRGWRGRAADAQPPPPDSPPPWEPDPQETPQGSAPPPQDPPAGTEVATRPADGAYVIPAALLAELDQAVATIPESDGDGGVAIARQLLTAKNLDDLNRPWESTSGKELAGKTLQIRGLIQRPSDYAEGPPFYLICDCVDVKTGQQITMTTSALSTIVQLAQAWRWGIFPITAEVVVAARPTKKGHLPYHLRVIGANVPAPS